MTTYRWRALTVRDLDAVAEIAKAAFPLHYEDPVHFAERLARGPAWCFALETGREDGAGTLKGYLIASPWPLGRIPPLNASLGAVSRETRSLFLHDLALSADTTGGGLAQRALQRLAHDAAAAGFTSIALVAVNATEPFWRRHGFKVIEDDPDLAAKLAAYGAGARYMVRRLMQS